MKTDQAQYTRFALCREMMETPDIIRQFDPGAVEVFLEMAKEADGILLTGEGSSRLFPSKRARADALRNKGRFIPVTEGATQAMEYDLGGTCVLGASNSGRTRELVRLYKALSANGHSRLGGLTANRGTPLEEVSNKTLVLSCGAEKAVAASKSVVEQAMVWHALINAVDGRPFPDTEQGSRCFAEALQIPLPEGLSRKMAQARTIFFAGRNDGVAEELTLKTNEIVRKQSDYLEGTYAAHGVEEIITESDVIILIDPFPEEEEKLAACLVKGAGATVAAIADRETLFPTVKAPSNGDWKEYIQLAAGWNLLVEAGIQAGVELDTTVRARKVGNEVGGTSKK